MPTYQYECRECRKFFDAYVPIKNRDSARCPTCGNTARRLISPGAGFLFKGSGFYVTDYRSKEYEEKRKAEVGK